jgi:hypothetical protein
MSRSSATALALAIATALPGRAVADDDGTPPSWQDRRRADEGRREQEAPPAPTRPRQATLWPVWSHGLAEQTDLASSFEPRHRVDVRVTVGYQHRETRGQVKREVDSAIANQDSALDFRDLVLSHSRDELWLRAEIGLFRDLMFHAELPIVLSEQTTLSYDRTASPCTLPPAANATCVAAANSSTVADGIVPASGYDATLGGGGTNDPVLFRGARRGAVAGSGADGLDTFNFGLAWAPLSQRRDPSKPTWVLAIEPHISIGNLRSFDRAAPDANHAVADGIHRIVFRTAVSRRVGRFEPYFTLAYLLPIPRSDSAFIDYGTAQKIKDPQQEANALFGTEIVAYERGRPDWRVVIDVRGKLGGHFAGRGYSEVWEMFASSPALRCDPMTNPSCDATTTKNAYQDKPYSGLTAIDAYATLGVELAIDALLSRWLRLRAGFAYARDQSHLITGDDIGTPSMPGARVSAPGEFNPAYRPVIDQPGRRYRVDNVDTFDARFAVQGRF